MTNPTNYSNTSLNKTNYIKSNDTEATNYSKTNPNANNYGHIRKTFFKRLLQNGAYRLLQNGTSKRLLESSVQNKSNYTKTTLNPTNYSTI